MNENILGDAEKFEKLFRHYFKHSGLEIDLTTKDGRQLTINHKRSLEGDLIKFTLPNGESDQIHLSEISKADIYAT